MPTGIAQLYVESRASAILREGDGRTWRLQATGNQMMLEPLVAPAAPRLPSDDALPDALIAAGERDIRSAWLAGPTDRYPHGVLGDKIEATTVRVETAAGQHLTYTLEDGSVFEDRYPRLADLDGDGRDELVIVRSYPAAGAAVTVFGIRAGALALLAESAAIGEANRWLNPAGFPDVDGDGRLEVAVVETPHIGGTLQVYRYDEKTGLTPAWQIKGFSNHALGSPELDMAAVVDFGGDGRHELILPNDDRRTVYRVGLGPQGLFAVRLARHADPVSTAILAGDFNSNGRTDLLYGLADGRLVFCSF